MELKRKRIKRNGPGRIVLKFAMSIRQNDKNRIITIKKIRI
jgi:hypothetical protein